MRLATALLLVLATSASAQQISVTPIATGLAAPVALTHANDGRLFITLQGGQIAIHDGTGIRATPFLDIDPLVLTTGERGLLSTAFHPQYAQNGRFFVFYTDATGDLVIARYQVSATDPNVADEGSGTVILTIPHRTNSNHNGGQLQFGPDGFLYIGTGDGGGGGDTENNAQNRNSLLGKILRIDVDSAPLYAIPPSNPFVGQPGVRPEIWAYGLRNPWRFSFDRATGDLFIADVGQGSWEEVDYQPATSTGGENYGWRIMEGTHCFIPNPCDPAGLTPPIIEYGHVGGACSVTGGNRYRGTRSTRMQGMYIYGDFCNGVIWGATRNPNGTWSSAQLLDAPFNISSFGENAAGEIYVVDYGGRVLLIEEIGSPSITSVTPNSGRTNGGEPVTISGANFGNLQSVTFGGVAATVTQSSSSSITVITPAASQTGIVTVAVTTPVGTATAQFRYDTGVPTNVIATASSTTSVVISWTAAPGSQSYDVVRSADRIGFSFVGSTAGTTLTDMAAAPSTAYVYKVRADGGDYSAVDVATTVMFTDDPLEAGTAIKAEHVRHLRTAANLLRRLANLDAVSFTDPDLTSGATPVRAVHITQLRIAIDEARNVIGVPPIIYTDPSLGTGTIIKAAHVRDARSGVK